MSNWRLAARSSIFFSFLSGCNIGKIVVRDETTLILVKYQTRARDKILVRIARFDKLRSRCVYSTRDTTRQIKL